MSDEIQDATPADAADFKFPEEVHGATDDKLRSYTHIGEGQEAKVWTSEREGRTSGVVLKDYKGGIDSISRTQYETQYNRLRAVYGELIPRQRLMKKSGEADAFVVAQQRIQPAERPNLMDYKADELTPKTKQQLERLIQLIREQYKVYKQDRNATDAYTLPDFAKKDNFLVTEDGDIKYVDTGTLQDYSRLNDEADARMLEAPVALLELISGKNEDEIMNDPQYARLVSSFKRTGSMSATFEDYLRNRYSLKGEIL